MHTRALVFKGSVREPTPLRISFKTGGGVTIKEDRERTEFYDTKSTSGEGWGRRHLVILGLSNNTFFYIGGPYKNNLQLIPFRVLWHQQPCFEKREENHSALRIIYPREFFCQDAGANTNTNNETASTSTGDWSLGRQGVIYTTHIFFMRSPIYIIWIQVRTKGGHINGHF